MASRRTSIADILSQIPPARARADRERRAGRRARTAYYDRRTGYIMVELTSGYLFGFPARSIPSLTEASAAELASVELFPGGSVLHWESLDADLSVPGLLLSCLGRAEKLSELGRLAGQCTTTAKAAAARKNGAMGGRPRKATSPR